MATSDVPEDGAQDGLLVIDMESSIGPFRIVVQVPTARPDPNNPPTIVAPGRVTMAAGSGPIRA